MSGGLGFGDRLAAAMRAHGRVCVGIDPHASLLGGWGLADDAGGAREFSLRVVEALGGRVAAFKPQAAFFERFGSRGVAVLEEVVAACREAGTLCIVDAKRGDIGSTMDGYAQAFLSDSSPLAGDAVTLSPYLGVGSLRPALEAAAGTGRGVFVLALTSNPEGASVQHARGADGRSVAAAVVDELASFNAECGYESLGPAGVVVGATVGSAVADLGVDLAGLHGALLAPGVGAQGAGPEEVRRVFAGAGHAVLASSSRAVLRAGPSVEGLRAAYEAARSGL
ncbi:orotidine-5'-phosphate decarboxylase [Actinomyces sp. B33]|uniref:orotidine-5'-phosphate decarboxylase n=1 Tax=Actinomyces sp. B33 TaxID=2942131 RepID=UPI0023420CC9|nr:orotidine-5'-phosphate decarboxylase [Actinomyces sp. B33]MDC4233328.1 orotidine-5'-phosphate decarboxylase [Actinomyces sp. B33]